MKPPKQNGIKTSQTQDSRSQEEKYFGGDQCMQKKELIHYDCKYKVKPLSLWLLSFIG